MASSAPIRSLPPWVLELHRDRRANVVLAVTVADAVSALGERAVPSAVARYLLAIVAHAEEAGGGIPVSAAARLLDITQPTVRTWIRRGVLDVVPDAKPVSITPRSLGEALAASSTIRRIGQDERRLRRLLDALEDQRTRLELAGRIDELDSAVEIDPEHIAEQVFGDRTSRSA